MPAEPPVSGYDLHTHLAPALDAVVSAGVTTAAGSLVVDGHPVGPADLYRPRRLVEALDAAGLAFAAVAIPPPLFRQHGTESQAGTWVRAVNHGLLRATAAYDRLLPLAYLPFEHPDLAIAEYRRVRAEPAWAGVTAAAGGGSVSLADPRLDELWELLAGDARLLQLHPGPPADPRLREHYLHNLVGFPVETAIAAAQLVMADVPRRYPALRILLLHCGGAMPALVGRWQRGVQTRRPGLPEEMEDPLRAVRRFYVDCLSFHPAVLDLAIEVVGADHIVIGSDWPFPMGGDVAQSLRRERGDAFLERVAVRNAERALGRPPGRDG